MDSVKPPQPDTSSGKNQSLLDDFVFKTGNIKPIYEFEILSNESNPNLQSSFIDEANHFNPDHLTEILKPAFHEKLNLITYDEIVKNAGAYMVSKTISGDDAEKLADFYKESFVPKPLFKPQPIPSSEIYLPANMEPSEVTVILKGNQQPQKLTAEPPKLIEENPFLTPQVPQDIAELSQQTQPTSVEKAKPKARVEAEQVDALWRAPQQEGAPVYVEVAPRFTEQLQDSTRDNRITYGAVETGLMGGNPSDPELEVTISEHEALKQLDGFLRRYIAAAEAPGPAKVSFSEVLNARSMLENLTFIGKKEYDAAVKGLAEYWAHYLREHPENTICVPLQISGNSGVRKSDTFLFENIVMALTEVERQEFAGRIITDQEKLKSAPTHTKIIVLDDWTISGSQARNALNTTASHFDGTEYVGRIEANFITASAKQLSDGLSTDAWALANQDINVPVKAYYLAHEAKESQHGVHISGWHSSVDYSFENTIDAMRRSLKIVVGEPVALPMPPPTNIIRSYRREEPRVVIEPDGRIRTRVYNETNND